MAVSTLNDLSEQGFQLIIPEIDEIDAKKVERVILCSGKIYYELLEKRRKGALNNIAIIRIEQLYPFPEDLCRRVIQSYSKATDIVWCQEEPKNQGAWTAVRPYVSKLLSKGQKLFYVGRSAAASPAVGYHSVHEKEQEGLVTEALTK